MHMPSLEKKCLYKISEITFTFGKIRSTKYQPLNFKNFRDSDKRI